MKKTIWLLFIILMTITFFSCGEHDYTVEIKENLVLPIEFSASVDEYSFNLTKNNGITTIEITSPKTLKGLIIERKGTTVTAKYQGILVTLPVSAANKLLKLDDALDGLIRAIENNNFITSNENESITFTATEGKFVYTLLFNTQENKILSFEIYENDNKTTFTINNKQAEESSFAESSNAEQESSDVSETSGSNN